MNRVTCLVGITIIFLAACSLSNGQATLTPPVTAMPLSTSTLPAPATVPPTPTSSPTVQATTSALIGQQSNVIEGQSPIFDQEKLGTVDRNVTYCVMGNYPVPMDVYYPRTMNGPWPVVINVHGGAWRLNSQLNGQGLQVQPQLNALGFLVVSVDYRNATQWVWPAMIEDVKCAVRSLRAHALEYNLDPNRIGAVGDSVGGQLVLLLALTDPSAGWDVGPYLDYSSQVQAVVDFFGPTDLTDRSLFNLIRKWGLNEFGDIRYTSPVLIAASPITYVNPYTPPILIIQGNEDTTVPLAQSEMLYDRLAAVGAPALLVVVKNGIHELGPVYHQSPTTDEIYQMVVSYFTGRLRSVIVSSRVVCWNTLLDPPNSPGYIKPVGPGCLQPR